MGPGESSKGKAGEMKVGVDFPIVCETCLGPNPYLRMVKLQFGDKMCKISSCPFQGFRWKAGPQGRFKETIISREVAVDKNICQACLVDMTYGVPVGVRDALLANMPQDQMVEARSEANQMYYYNQKAAEVDSGGAHLVHTREAQPISSRLAFAFALWLLLHFQHHA